MASGPAGVVRKNHVIVYFEAFFGRAGTGFASALHLAHTPARSLWIYATAATDGVVTPGSARNTRPISVW
ncbi:hypothetical protein SBA3_50026 [Candidatus Sulfopaludibacter sp. SbA3]|nr:hypothetical protein SBA3_50026 [Candidatus Sulfopaludibacter sp. SbA3]